MSKLLGSMLPDALHRRWSSDERRPGRVIIVHTLDPSGWPHPALLSEFEVFASAPERLRIAVHRRSQTAANLRERAPLTLVSIEPDGVYYIKAKRTAEAASDGPAAVFELAITAALVDQAHADETDTTLETGLRFVAGGRALSYFERVFADLLSDRNLQ